MSDSLREQFINTLELLTSNDKMCCEIYTDFYCEIFYSCDKTNCNKCKSKHKIKADVIFENVAEDVRFFYVFKKQDKRDYITIINTEEELYKELSRLNTLYINTTDKEDLKYYRKIEELKKYARQFFEQIAENYFATINKNILPIEFHYFSSEEEGTGGELIFCNNQHIINIYGTGFRSIEELKKTIRHEIIHYCLYISKYKYDDDTAVFHVLCKLCDARAYKPMPPEEEKLYNQFWDRYEKWNDVSKEFEKKGFTKENYIMALLLLISGNNEMIQKVGGQAC